VYVVVDARYILAKLNVTHSMAVAVRRQSFQNRCSWVIKVCS
jgi:hypothetical protein